MERSKTPGSDLKGVMADLSTMSGAAAAPGDPHPAPSLTAAEPSREEAAPVAVGGACPDPAQPTVAPLALQPEGEDDAPPPSPCPDPSQPGPNLYPDVRITHNPGPAPGDVTVGQIPDAVPAAPTTPPVLPPLPRPTAADEESQPPQQAQPPEGQPAEGQPAEGPPPQTKPAQTPPPQEDSGPDPPIQATPPSPAVVPVIQEPVPPAPAQPLPHGLPSPRARPAPDTLSYLESASLMSGTLESLSGLGEDCSSVGSDSEVNGLTVRRTDKYGFLGGSQYSESGEKELRVEVARQREVKWLDMFRNWDKWIKQRFQKVKLRCRKGIPSSLRARAWQMLSNSQELLEANPGKFQELEREQGEAKWLDIIEKDLHRQFPFHEMFAARGGHGQQDLYRILKAYTIYRPDEGYCQAQAPVAAVLLMHMPAEQAFWCLVTICEKYLPGYYSAGLEAIQLDGEIFFSLLRRTCPMAYRHLKKFKIDPILYMTEWFMCIFSRTLPWSCVLRVWDMFFCEGVKIIFRVGLVLLKQMLGSVEKLREVQGMYETMERLRNISPDSIKEEQLVQEIVTLPISESLIERESNAQVRKWRESRGELSHQPSRRLHGSRDVFQQKRRAAAISSGGSFSFLGSGATPPPGPLRSSSSLLSLPGFRRSKAPLPSPAKKAPPPSSSPPPADPPSSAQKPPMPPGAAQKAVAATVTGSPRGPAPTPAPSPKIVSEQITPTIPSPTANNAPLPPCEKGAGPAAAEEGGEGGEEEDGSKKKKKSKEEKKKEKEDEKKKLKERKEKEKLEKERMRKEKEKKKGGKKKERGGAGGGEGEEKNGAAAKETA